MELLPATDSIFFNFTRKINIYYLLQHTHHFVVIRRHTPKGNCDQFDVYLYIAPPKLNRGSAPVNCDSFNGCVIYCCKKLIFNNCYCW